MRCPVCGEGTLSVFFEMPPVPVHCNVLFDSVEEARAVPRGRIELGRCGHCSAIHNVAFDPSLLTYGAGYENSLHFSPRFQSWADEAARDLVERHRLQGRTVLEVGCGKGDFLAMLLAHGAGRAVGFDASYEGHHDHAGVEIVRTPWDAVAAAGQQAALVVCRHVLEHVPDPVAFASTLAAAVEPGGACYVEVPDAMWTLHDLGIWDVIYEHCTYFTAAALRRVLQRTGLGRVGTTSTFGGQFVAAEARAGEAEIEDPPPELAALVATFGREFERKVTGWSDLVTQRLERGQRLAVWGAGSKGVTFLNVVEGGGHVTSVIDVNPRKWGRFVAGTGQRVDPPARLTTGIDAVLVMNPIYRDEIGEQLAALGVAAELLVV